jgi:hypothetical protein
MPVTYLFFLALSRMTETLRVKGGIGALRVGVGEFALIPQEKNSFVAKTYTIYKKFFIPQIYFSKFSL